MVIWPMFPYIDTWRHLDVCARIPIAYSNIRSCVHIVVEVGCEDECGGGCEEFSQSSPNLLMDSLLFIYINST